MRYCRIKSQLRLIVDEPFGIADYCLVLDEGKEKSIALIMDGSESYPKEYCSIYTGNLIPFYNETDELYKQVDKLVILKRDDKEIVVQLCDALKYTLRFSGSYEEQFKIGDVVKVSNYYPKYEGQTGVVIEIINDKFYLERSDCWVSCKVRLESGEIAEFYDCCLYFADPTKDYVCKIVKWENIRRHR